MPTRDESEYQQTDIPEQEMKNKFILIGAVVVVVLATIFLYLPRESVSPNLPLTESAVAHATLKIGEKTYSVLVTPGETLLDAMTVLVPTSDLTFTGRDYPSLGFFVESINGIKNEKGMYWILYVNGTTSASGVSATTLKTRDIIEWKYEKGY